MFEPYGLRDVMRIRMTRQQLIDTLQPFFYNKHIEIHTYKNGGIEVIVNGFSYSRERLNKHTGIDLDIIQIKENNIDLWKELGK